MGSTGTASPASLWFAAFSTFAPSSPCRCVAAPAKQHNRYGCTMVGLPLTSTALPHCREHTQYREEAFLCDGFLLRPVFYPVRRKLLRLPGDRKLNR
jgi:hypothetical protein